jgi:hypothetical protein
VHRIKTALCERLGIEPVLTQCFSNAERKVREAGGGVLFGRMFHFREMATPAGVTT